MNYKQYLQKNNIDTTKRDTVFELSNLITEARLYAGISQAELAKRIGTQQPSIARADIGELEPSVSFLQKVAKAVNTIFVPPRFGFMLARERTLNIYVSARMANTQKMDLSESLPIPTYVPDVNKVYFAQNKPTYMTRQLQFA
ncbi:MAG: helix-turn-helix transcriptional regulator [Candidatus Taylorbacteria bacterium]|nr:helix-turn-helix transcriptional regulator [Candidatus Taylorbacteria bacterium]